MKLLFCLLLGGLSLSAQGWADLSSTHLSTVCPAINAGGNTYDFPAACHSVMDAWGGAAADTKRNRLIITGGGGPDYNGNEVYSLTLAGAISRLTNPSLYATSGCPDANVSDGTPVSRHTYNGLVYLPVPDRMFMFSGRLAPCDGGTSTTWTLDLSVTPPVWHSMEPVTGSAIPGGAQGGADCAYNPNDQNVWCYLDGADILFKYNYATNTRTTVNASFHATNYASMTLDPVHQLLIFMGRPFAGPTPSLEIVDISLGSAYAVQDLSSIISGCGTTLTAQYYPAITYDSARGKVAGYSGSGNSVCLFDPVTHAFTTQTFSSGPTTPTVNGQMSRFAYFPSAGKYLGVTTMSSDAFTFTLDTASISGVGSSTLTCLDEDGDGYGVGPGCTGPDADDRDATVHTGAQCVTAYSTLAGCLTHLGYTPANIWYVSTSGVDTGSPAACKNTIGSPCATASYVFAHGFAAGDMVLFRSGTFTNGLVQPPNGTSGLPVALMAYPGETVLFSQANTFNSLDAIDRSYIVMDGLSATLGTNSGCIDGGTSASTGPSAFHNNIFTHIHAYGCKWGLDAFNGLQYVDINENVFHDNTAGVAEHCVYIGSRGIVGLSVSVRRNLLYGCNFNGFQFNGRVTNLDLEQNISYNNLVSGFSFEMGVSNSWIRSNLAFQNENAAIQIANYPGDCSSFGQGGSDSICPYDQINNVFENNTLYQGNKAADGTDVTGSSAIALANSAVLKVGDLGNNTYRNNIFASTDNTNHYPEVVFQDAGTSYLSTSTFANNIFWHSDGSTGTGVIGNGPGSGFGYAPLTCAQAAMVGTVTNCVNSNPLFTASSTAYWNSVTSFNFKLLAGSPGNAAGTLTGVPNQDLYGVAFGATPSIGSNTTVGTGSGAGSVIGGSLVLSGSVVIH